MGIQDVTLYDMRPLRIIKYLKESDKGFVNVCVIYYLYNTFPRQMCIKVYLAQHQVRSCKYYIVIIITITCCLSFQTLKLFNGLFLQRIKIVL